MSRARWVRAGLLGAASVIVLSMAPNEAVAQSADLPTVRVTAPKQRAARRAPVRHAQPRPAPAAPAQQAASRPGPAGFGERGIGPVTGYLAHQSISSSKTDTPILVTPQSISVVTRDQMVAQGAQSIPDALRYMPGVTPMDYGPNAFFDSFKVRGFDAPRFLDGLVLPADATTFAAPRIEPFGLERLEVLKGPSSGLYGASNPGGIVNMISKRPQDTPHYSVEGNFGSYDRYQGAFDIGGPVDGAKEWLYRLVGLFRQSNTEVNYVQDNKIFIAPSLTWRPSIDTSFTILSQYQLIDNKGYQQYAPWQVLSGNNPLGRMSRSTYLGEPGYDGFRLEQKAIGYAFEHRFDNSVQFRQNFRYLEATQDLHSIRPEGMVGDNLVTRSYNYVRAKTSNVTLDNQFQADVVTGPLTHKVLGGFDYVYMKSNTDYRSAYAWPGLGAPAGFFSAIDAFNPVYGAPVPAFDSLLPFIKRDDTMSQAGFYVQDQIKLDRFTLTLSGRQDVVSTTVNSTGFWPVAGVYNRNDSAQTGRVGLNYLFDNGVSPYVTYSTSFTPNLGSDQFGNTFKPTTGDNIEFGVKYQPLGTNLLLTAAYFDTRQNNVLTADPTNPLFNTQTDAARVRGFEFEAKGNVTREFEIVAGYSHLDPKVTASIAGNVGKDLMNTARDQASLWGKYTWYNGPLAGLALGAGVRYVGDTYGDVANTLVVPAYTLVDAVISYDFGYMRPDLKGLSAQINVRNLTDKYYVGSCFTGMPYCSLGPGRTVLGTLKYSWNAEPAPKLITK
ncbi:MAG: TonB-dependent siderophore receptor [Xanthobacteraceae bacterium]|nr:TonB-dependent siderophore receptor [Xanthobacteraceae bacterium]